MHNGSLRQNDRLTLTGISPREGARVGRVGLQGTTELSLDLELVTFVQLRLEKQQQDVCEGNKQEETNF